ncbi:hypothetical protein B0H17DRAFT_1197287 [Mycena rosella]|uniref:Cytochrome b561 domain-containing protein n=1 Tax=Mycena rosella TaxID=1033263 RepID=A0AAD7GMA2_MYCRO|nr:hypothetical protein B0H17DRAFT_1197287 [Mycena rosella]
MSHGENDQGGAEGDVQDGGSTAGNLATIPLIPIEILVRNHAILCTIGFLILLPLGVLLARYARTFTRRWFWGHAVMQLVISGPVIFAGWAQGHKAANNLDLEMITDPHQKIGVALLALYVTQLLLGTFIHFVKMSFLDGHRPPQNYLHAILGLAILGLAAYQVHYGLTIEWLLTGGLHQRYRFTLVQVFWVLYFLGMALLPRQFSREKESRQALRAGTKEGELRA